METTLTPTGDRRDLPVRPEVQPRASPPFVQLADGARLHLGADLRPGCAGGFGSSAWAAALLGERAGSGAAHAPMPNGGERSDSAGGAGVGPCETIEEGQDDEDVWSALEDWGRAAEGSNRG